VSDPEAPVNQEAMGPRNRSGRQEAACGFARLLAGEIRLYNEEAVMVGRRRGDLAIRLERPIDRARARYLAHFSEVDPDSSYLRIELVRVLAGGKSDLLP